MYALRALRLLDLEQPVVEVRAVRLAAAEARDQLDRAVRRVDHRADLDLRRAGERDELAARLLDEHLAADLLHADDHARLRRLDDVRVAVGEVADVLAAGPQGVDVHDVGHVLRPGGIRAGVRPVLARVEEPVSVHVATDEGRDEIVGLVERRPGVGADPGQARLNRELDVAGVGDHGLDVDLRLRLDAWRAGLGDVDRGGERPRGCAASAFRARRRRQPRSDRPRERPEAQVV